MIRQIPGSAFPLGVSDTAHGLQFAIYLPKAKRIELQVRNGETVVLETDMEKFRVGRVCSVLVTGVSKKDWDGYTYGYMADGHWIVDPYATKIDKCSEWGEVCKKEAGIIAEEDFLWGDEISPSIPYHAMHLYQLHVRGFTKSASSEVSAPGTFQGLMDKIPYLKELGVNAILALPCYEFNEILQFTPGNMYEPIGEKKINYWGYGEEAYFFCPKAAYSSDRKNPQREMKSLIKALHAEGMEFLMDMHFPQSMDIYQMIDVLRFWILEYHVDGFYLRDNVVPVWMMAQDPVIGAKKLLATSFSGMERSGKRECMNWENPAFSEDVRLLAEYNDGFKNAARRFLRGEEGSISSFLERFSYDPAHAASVNYITSVNGYTLNDLVSYELRHNEENGELNRDGEEINYSWNCGAEGETKKKSVLLMREKQVKNALAMLYLGRGIPMLLAGDEFLQTQNGNNNPYCQDNELTWLDWSLLEKNKEHFEFVKSLITLRTEYIETISKEEKREKEGPRISFHGRKAWFVEQSNYSRFFAVLWNGKNSVYAAFNMHSTTEEFEFPAPLEGQEWKLFFYSDASDKKKKCMENQRGGKLAPHSSIILVSVPITETEEKGKKV